ncbi:MAG: flagellin [Lachnospiraceae bacterium]|nr:flagellin [Lachnospiraceae bacterium]
MKVNHNMTAIRTNLNLNRTNTNLDNVTYKLSSGYKINQAKDDPAGYAILKRLNRQIKGLDQANQNAADAIAAINTAEGALNEIHSILQRMSELATQSANDTNTPEDRDTIQLEIKELKDEINRISGTTDYNGKYLLNGDSQYTSYVAKDEGMMAESISIYSQSTTVDPGSYSITVEADPTKALLDGFSLRAGKLIINSEAIEVTQEEIDDKSIYDKIQAICDRCNIALEQEGDTLNFETYEYGSEAYLHIYYEGSETDYIYGTDVEASFTVTDDGCDENTVMSIENNIITLTNSNGFELKIKTETGAADEGEVTAEVKDASILQVQIGSDATNMLGIIFEKVSTETLGIEYCNVGTQELSSKAIEDLHNAINKVSDIRSKLGAYTNRLGYAQADLDVQSYNVEDASSRMGDTDMATSMTEYTELNVLEQATSSILSKANQRAEMILQLLQS